MAEKLQKMLKFPFRWNIQEELKEVVVSEVAKGLTVTCDMGWCLICHFTELAGRVWVFDWV
jgi:hypothetical protein